jgi:hypothetical protein
MAEKNKQILKLEPDSELIFRGPFTSVITSHLKLTNPSDRNVCFKVKTTAPRRYCVRPNSGVIKAKESADIAVMLQPFTYDPEEKNKHKFMVQSLIAPEDDDLKNLDGLFKEAAAKDLMDSKLKCIFDMPGEPPIKPSKAGESESIPTNRRDENITPTSTGVLTENGNKHTKLEQELNRLIDENKKLKDSETRLKKLALSDSMHTSNLPSGGTSNISSNTNAGGGVLSVFPPILFMMLAFIIGLIIGKFVL